MAVMYVGYEVHLDCISASKSLSLQGLQPLLGSDRPAIPIDNSPDSFKSPTVECGFQPPHSSQAPTVEYGFQASSQKLSGVLIEPTLINNKRKL